MAFEETEFELLLRHKGQLNWHDYILAPIEMPRDLTTSEAAAYLWLKSQGATKINHVKRQSPDFITDIGNFEVKLINDSNSIVLNRIQIKEIKEYNATILTFDHSGLVPKTQISPERLPMEDCEIDGVRILVR